MFTGLIDERGRLVERRGDQFVFTLPSNFVGKLREGSSIAVDGACLTVVGLNETAHTFQVDVSSETITRTTLSDLTPRDRVNLELPLHVADIGGRIEGHLVQGHVDAIGQISTITRERSNFVFRFTVGSPMKNYIVEKGTIAVDGVSLTPFQVKGTNFATAIISHTYHQTTFKYKSPGSKVNIEFDLMAKYVEKIVSYNVERSDL